MTRSEQPGRVPVASGGHVEGRASLFFVWYKKNISLIPLLYQVPNGTFEYLNEKEVFLKTLIFLYFKMNLK